MEVSVVAARPPSYGHEMQFRGESRVHRLAAVGLILFQSVSAVASVNPSRADDRWRYEAAVDEFVDDVLDRSSERHRETLAKLLPDTEVTKDLRRHWSPWREELNREASHMGCGRFLAWAGFSQYLGTATILSFGFPPYGLAAWLFLPPAALFMSWVGFPRSHVPSPATNPLEALRSDVEAVRRDHHFERAVGWKNDPWTRLSFDVFRDTMRARIEDRLEALEDSIDQQSTAGFGASQEKIDRWMLDYLELWDLAGIYEIESRRYVGSWVGHHDDYREAAERERLGIAVDEIRTAIVVAAGGSYRRDR